MKRLILAGLTVAALGLAALTPAQAQGGCGPYAHRGWNGWCHPNGYGGPGPWGHGWHRPWGPGYGWHRHGWGYHHHW